MATDDRELRELLAQLHTRLHGAKSVDASSRDQLKEVATDIEAALARSGARPVSVESRLEELAAKFEVEHPALAEAVRDIVDALGKAGI
jgi:Domain of unknown function (DUF4404)